MLLPTQTKRKTLASMALASLMITSFGASKTDAAWGAPRCALQCTEKSCGTDAKRLNECIANCDSLSSIDNCLLPNLGEGKITFKAPVSKDPKVTYFLRTKGLLRIKLDSLNKRLTNIVSEQEATKQEAAEKQSKGTKAPKFMTQMFMKKYGKKMRELAEEKKDVQENIHDLKAILKVYEEHETRMIEAGKGDAINDEELTSEINKLAEKYKLDSLNERLEAIKSEWAEAQAQYVKTKTQRSGKKLAGKMDELKAEQKDVEKHIEDLTKKVAENKKAEKPVEASAERETKSPQLTKEQELELLKKNIPAPLVNTPPPLPPRKALPPLPSIKEKVEAETTGPSATEKTTPPVYDYSGHPKPGPKYAETFSDKAN